MNTALIYDRVSRLTQKYGIPAWGMIIYRHQREVYRHVEGFSDYARTIPATDGDVYWLYSLSKLATCTAAMQLIERGKLSLDEQVKNLLPAFEKLRVLENGRLRPARKPLTVIDLMTMRGGLDYDLLPLTGRTGEAATNDALIDAIAQKPLSFDPGAHFKYSLCHDVLGGVIAAASGISFDKWLETELFAPLGMHETRFASSSADRSFSAQYIYQNGACVPTVMENVFVFSPSYCSGGAGLSSTLPDYVLLINALANGGMGANGCRILGEESVRNMALNRLTVEQLPEMTSWRPGYGYGLGVRTRIHDASNPKGVIEFGWDGAAGSYALADITNNVAVLYMQHVRACDPAYDDIHPTIRDTVLEAL